MKRLGLSVAVIVACLPCILVAGSREALRAAAAVPAGTVLVILALLAVLAILYLRR